jgi:hypothetical protein
MQKAPHGKGGGKWLAAAPPNPSRDFIDHLAALGAISDGTSLLTHVALLHDTNEIVALDSQRMLVL